MNVNVVVRARFAQFARGKRMDKKKTLLTIEANFEADIENMINPLYDIEQNVHKSTIDDLKELFGAVGDFAFDEGVKFAKLEKGGGE